jgi:hypothetical protein
MDGLLPKHRAWYAHDFHFADAAFHAGRLAATTAGRESCWNNWVAYVAPVEVDPLPQGVPFGTKSRPLTGFAQRVREGYYGQGTTVRAGTVCTAITAIGQTIAMANGENPTKMLGLEKFFLRLQQCIKGYRKQDPVSQMKLPVEADIPKYLVECALDPSTNELHKAVGDLSLIAFYYLLRVGEYTTKGKRDNSKQTVQFKMEDIHFFAEDKRGWLRCLLCNASDDNIGADTCAALKLDNQKNGWKGVSIYHETNGDPTFCPIKAIG